MVRPLSEIGSELLEIMADMHAATHALSSSRPDLTVIAHQAQWHMRGAIYHTNALLAAYAEFASGVGARAQIDVQPAVLVMYAPSLQEVLYNFYALVNLARITLDNLRIYLRPVFTTAFGQLPKSITGFLEGETDCPVYLDLQQRPIVTYLSDLRNCLVHFRSFATGDNAVVVDDHLPREEEKRLMADMAWFDHMAHARFRRTSQGISVNVLLPDKIFERTPGTEKLASFTYNERINLVSQAMAFTRLTAHVLGGVFVLLHDPGKPVYSFRKSRKA